MSSPIGFATLQVIPSMKGVSGELSKQVGAPLASAGKKAGADMGKSVADGLAGAKAAVEKSSGVLAAARNKEADAAGKLRVAEDQLQDLVKKGITDGPRHTAAVEKVAKAQRDNATAAEKTKKATADLAAAEGHAADAAKDLGNESDKAADSVEGVGKKSLISGDNLVKFGALAAAGVAAAGAALFAMGSQFADMSNTIRVGTGASGENLDALVGVAKNLGSEVPASFEDIGTTVADLNTRLGLTGDPLQVLSRQFLELGKMGIDADVNEVSAAFTAFGVTGSDTSGALDELFQVSQATGVSVNDLAASAVKGGPALQQFGFSLGSSAALVGTLDKAGLDADKTLGSMNKALMQFAEDGKDPQQALYGTVVEIENLIGTGKEAAALDLAGGIFGTKGAGQFVEAVRNGTLSVDDFVSATGATSDTIIGVADETRTFSDQWLMFKNDVLVELEPVATRVFGAITEAMGWLKDTGVPAVKEFAEWVGNNKPLLTDLGIAVGAVTVALTLMVAQQKIAAAGGFITFIKNVITSTGAWSVAQGIFNAVMNANPLMLVVTTIGLLVGAFVLAYRNSETFRNIVTGAFDAVKKVIVGVWDWISENWPLLLAIITGPIGMAVYLITKNWDTIKEGAAAAKDWIVEKFDALVGFITGLPGKIGSAASGMWDGIMNSAKSVFNTVAGWWNRSLGSIKWSVPDWVPGVGGKSIGFPKMPTLRDGGIAGRNKDGTLWGPGTGTSDSILGVDMWGMPTALVSTDEGVVKKSAMDNGGSELVGALNAGWTPSATELHSMFPDLPGFAGGGAVSGPGIGDRDKPKTKSNFYNNAYPHTPPATPTPVDTTGNPGRVYGPPSGVEAAPTNYAAPPVFGNPAAPAAPAAPVAPVATSGGGGIGEPYGLPTGSSISYGAAGFPDWVTSLGSKYGLQASTYPGHQEGDRGEAGYAPNPQHLNRGIDWSGPIAAMQTYAEWLLTIAPKSTGLEQVIWQNPNTGQKIGWAGRSADSSGSYFASDYSGHQDHVHTRTSASIGDVAPADSSSTSADTASTSSAAGATSTTTETTSAPEKEQVFSARDRIKTMFTDVAGIWADSAIEIAGGGEWLDLADRYTITPGTTSSTSAQSDTMSKAEADAAITAGTTGPVDTTVRTGHDLYAYEIARAAKDMGLPESAAVIGEAAALVEVGDPLKMFANAGLPASLNLPHDAVGRDGSSTGLFQQQDFAEWGTLEQRMNPFESAKMFYEKFPQGWESMDPGGVAQAVQRSAFPSKYADMMGRGQELVDNTSLFDTGGWLMPGEFGFNGLNEPEPVLKNAHWKVAESNIAKVDELVGAGVGGGPRVQIVNNNHQIIADQESWQRDQASQQRHALMRFGVN